MKTTQTLKQTDTYGKLLKFVQQGEIEPGGRLPNERDLAKSLNVARGKIREALTRMEVEGIVERKVGAGTFMSKTAATVLEIRDAGVDLDKTLSGGFTDMIEARLIFEPSVSLMAASKCTTDDAKKLRYALEKIAIQDNWLEFKEAIYAFHRLVYVIADNKIMLSIFDSMHQERRKKNYGGRNLNAIVAKFIRKHAAKDLESIANSICERRGDDAATHSSEYLLRLLTHP